MSKIEGLNKAAVIGAGLMGHGVAVDFVKTGYETWMYNTRDESSKLAMKRVRVALDRFVEGELMTKAEADAAYSVPSP